MRPALLVLAAALTLAACDSSGSGTARAGDTVTVRYVGSLADGTVFDQSDRATFSLARVILTASLDLQEKDAGRQAPPV